MTLEEIIRRAKGFTADSRLIEAGFLFFALEGERSDGHQFLREAAAKGAIGAVVRRSYEGPTQGLTLVRVENVLEALQQAAKMAMKKKPMRVVAVTGSVGKTTTKEFLSQLLSKKYRVLKTEGNANSQVGFPLTILNQKKEGEIFVAEMGMSYEGEIHKLVQIAPPELAILTRVGHAHIGNFSDGMEGIARAKAEIFSHPLTQVAVVNAQAAAFSALKNLRCPTVTFGVGCAADFRLDEGWVIDEMGGKTDLFHLPFKESHLVENFLAAASAARLLGVEWNDIFNAARFLTLPPLRFERKEKSGILFISDCYNANPESMAAAICNLPSPGLGGKTIAVFGEMTELGAHSEEEHRIVARHASPRVDHILCYGKGCLAMMPLFSEADRPAEFFTDLRDLKEALFELAKPGDVVLIKGSNANRLWQVLD